MLHVPRRQNCKFISIFLQFQLVIQMKDEKSYSSTYFPLVLVLHNQQ